MKISHPIFIVLCSILCTPAFALQSGTFTGYTYLGKQKTDPCLLTIAEKANQFFIAASANKFTVFIGQYEVNNPQLDISPDAITAELNQLQMINGVLPVTVKAAIAVILDKDGFPSSFHSVTGNIESDCTLISWSI